MAQIIKASSGFLYKEENFGDPSLLWDVSPNIEDRIVLEDGSISLLPGNERMELLITAPENNYVAQIEIDYTPSTKEEKGGFMFKSVTDNIIELETCGEDMTNFRYAKLIVDSNNILDAKSSTDGKLWYERGDTKLIDMNKIGFYIGENTTADTIKIKNFTLYKDTNIYINNIAIGNYIKIFDENDNEVTDNFVIKKINTQTCIDGTNLLFPIPKMKIQVFDKETGELISGSEIYDVYGGDIFEFRDNISFYIDDHLLDNSIYDLGIVQNKKKYTLKIENNDIKKITNRKLYIQYYSLYNPGYKLAKISKHNEDKYTDSLFVDLDVGETKSFTLKIERDLSCYNIDDGYYFNIVFE